MKYTLHPKLVLSIKTTGRNYQRYFDNEYLKLSSHNSDADAINIDVEIVSRLPKPEENDRKRSFMFKKLFKQEYLVRGLETSDIKIYYKDTVLGKVYSKFVTLFLQTNVIEPIIYYKLLSKDVLFMHAAGASYKNSGFLFPAYGGTGKTTLTLGLMAEGMSVLGDDLILVDAKTGSAIPYLRPLHLFAYNIKTLRGAKIPFSLKLTIKFKDILRAVLETITRQEFLIATRVHASDLYPDFRASKTVDVKKLVFLKKEGDHQKMELTDEKVDELSKIVLASEDLNDSLYEYVLEENEKAGVITLELEVIEKLIRKIGYFEFVNTRKLDFNDLKKFRDSLI